MKEVIYIAGKYTAPTKEGVQANVDKATAKGAELAGQGYAPIVPHANTTGWEQYNPNLTYRDFMLIDFAQIRKVDVVYMMDNWKDSRGAKAEERFARLLKKKIIYEATEPSKRPTYQSYEIGKGI